MPRRNRPSLLACAIVLASLCGSVGSAGRAAAQAPLLHTTAASRHAFTPAGPTAAQDVRPVPAQRGVFIDGTVRQPAAHGWAMSANPLGEPWNRNAMLGEVHLATGAYAPTQVDLALPAVVPWRVTRSLNGVQRDSSGSHRDGTGAFGGTNWYHDELPQIAFGDDDGVLYVVYGADRYIEFVQTEPSSGEYRGTNGAAGVVKLVAASGEEPETYEYHDQAGLKTTFFGVVAGGSSSASFQLWKVEEPGGSKAYVGHPTSAAAAAGAYSAGPGMPDTAYDSAGRRFTYKYSGSGSAARLTQILAEANSGTWTEVGRVEYEYHDGTTSSGSAGDLKLVTVRTPTSSGAPREDRTYMRYYKGTFDSGSNPGAPHALKLVLGPDGLRRYTAEVGTSPGFDAATDASLKQYADTYLSYAVAGDDRLSCATFAGCCGCSGTGSGEYCFTYGGCNQEVDPGCGTTYTQPDGLKVSQTFDGDWQPLGRAQFTEVTTGGGTSLDKIWATGVVRDSAGVVTRIASPENVDANFDLGTGDFTAGAMGLVTDFARVSDTPHAALAGLPEHVTVRYGTAGGATYTSSVEYAPDTATSGPASFVKSFATTSIVRPNVVATHRYPDPAGSSNAYNASSSPAVTEYVSTPMTQAASGALYPSESLREPKAVSTARNGSGSTFESRRHYLPDGRVDFAKSPEGYISYTGYSDSGQVVKSIQDAATSHTDLSGVFIPSGYTTTTGVTPVHLVTMYTYDAQGRLDETLLPSGRRTKYVYAKLLDERPVVLRIPRVVTSGSTTTYYGPVGYTVSSLRGKPEFQGTIAIAPSGTTVALSSWISAATNDPILAVNSSVGTVARMSAEVYDTTGTRALESRSYFSIPGSGTGTAGTHYGSTTYGYDDMGRQLRVKDATGTIDRTVYDVLGRVTQRYVGTNDNQSTFTDTLKDSTGTGNMVKVEELEYDGGSDQGNSLLTKRTLFVDGTTTGQRVTEYTYDFRGRLRLQKNPVAPHTLIAYDNLNRAVAVAQYSAITGSGFDALTTDPAGAASDAYVNRVSLTRSFYDDNGRQYLTYQDAVAQTADAAATTCSSGSVTRAAGQYVDDPACSIGPIATLTWYDKSGRAVKTRGEQLTKTAYDRLGRAVKQFTLAKDDDASYSDVYDTSANATKVDGDHVLVENQMAYNSLTGMAVMSATISRFYDDYAAGTTGPLYTGTDPLSIDSSSTYLKGRAQIVATWYDELDRPTESVQYGTNGGATFQRKPSGTWLTVPARSASALRTSTEHDTDGTVLQVTDPRGIATRYLYDRLGRKTASIANYTGTIGSTADRDHDVYTRYAYAAGQMTKMWVDLDGDNTEDSDDQVTRYEYDTTDSAVSAHCGLSVKNLMTKAIYPPQNSTQAEADRTVLFGYNAQRQQTWTKDQVGVELAMSYDVGGRLTTTIATIPAGSGIDAAVRSIRLAYSGRGQVETVTQYATTTSTTVVDQVKYEYDDRGMLATLYEDPNSEVAAPAATTGWRDDIRIAFTHAKAGPGVAATGGRNTVRRTSFDWARRDGSTGTYLYTKNETFSYLSTDGTNGLLDDAASRVSKVLSGTAELAAYKYNGMSQLVVTSVATTSGALGYSMDGTTARYFDRLDAFDRVVRSHWKSQSGATFYDSQPLYDAASNILAVKDGQVAGRDVLYGIDGLGRVASADEGTLNTGNTAITTRTRLEDWSLTQTGNFKETRLDLTGDGDFTDASEHDQERDHSLANEITARRTPTPTSTAVVPAYNKRGDMTDDGYEYTYVYDAFGRMRSISTRGPAARVIAEYRYNGLNQRIAWRYDSTRAYSWYQPQPSFDPFVYLPEYGLMGPDGQLDDDDPWFVFAYDERWRMVATYRERTPYEASTEVPIDLIGDVQQTYLNGQPWSSPKEVFYNHQAGPSGLGGSSYIDLLIRADRDEVLSDGAGLPIAYFHQPPTGALDQKWLVLQNWRADVVAIASTAGAPLGRTRYSAYGVPHQLTVADRDGNGVVNAADITEFLGDWFGSCTGVGVPDPGCLGDADFDGSGAKDVSDIFAFLSAYFSDQGAAYGSLRAGLSRGYAGYEHDGIVQRVYHVRNRVFDTDLGRWTRRDPLGYVDGMNMFQYTLGAPLNSTDPSGLDRWVVDDPHPYVIVEIWSPDCRRVIGYYRIEFGQPISFWILTSVVAAPGQVAITPVPGPGAPAWWSTGWRIPSDCEADRYLVNWANAMMGQPPAYSLLFYNCRHFAAECQNVGLEETRWMQGMPFPRKAIRDRKGARKPVTTTIPCQPNDLDLAPFPDESPIDTPVPPELVPFPDKGPFDPVPASYPHMPTLASEYYTL